MDDRFVKIWNCMNYKETAQKCNHSQVHTSYKAACRYKIIYCIFIAFVDYQLCKYNLPYIKIYKCCCVSEMFGVFHYPAHFH